MPTIAAMPRPRCRHCRVKAVCRPRRLCWTYYYSPARDLYPPMPAAESGLMGSRVGRANIKARGK